MTAIKRIIFHRFVLSEPCSPSGSPWLISCQALSAAAPPGPQASKRPTGTICAFTKTARFKMREEEEAMTWFFSGCQCFLAFCGFTWLRLRTVHTKGNVNIGALQSAYEADGRAGGELDREGGEGGRRGGRRGEQVRLQHQSRDREKVTMLHNRLLCPAAAAAAAAKGSFTAGQYLD